MAQSDLLVKLRRKYCAIRSRLLDFNEELLGPNDSKYILIIFC